MIFAIVQNFLPFMILPLYASIEKLPQRLLEASQDLGASPARTFWKVTVPLTMPGIAAGCILVFIPVLGIFALPEFIHEPTRMIGGQINLYFTQLSNPKAGSALTLVLTGINDRSVITVTVGGLADLSGNPLAGDSDVSVRALAGDVNGNGVVDQLDFLFVRRALLRPLTDQTFLADINLDGAVDTIDLLYVRRSDGHVVP